MPDQPNRVVSVPLRTAVLSAVLLALAIAIGFLFMMDNARYALSDVLEVEPAAKIPALIVRYDTELATQDQLVALMHQDREIGIRATAFPLTEDFQTRRNVLQRYAIEAGEVQLHARPMPAGLSDAYKTYNDQTSYSYSFLDKDEMTNAFVNNLVHELRILRSNGFNVRGFSLHAIHNRLPWDDETNYRIVAIAAAATGLDWVSVTSQAFSLGSDRSKTDYKKFNQYDRDVTIRQHPFWVTVRTGWFSSRRVLVIPTSWRDRYGIGLFGQSTYKGTVDIMRQDIERQWQAAHNTGSPVVLLFHPVGFTLKSPQESQHLKLRRSLVERAKSLGVPIMTFSEYYEKARAAH